MAQIGNFQNFTWDQLEAAKNSRKALIKKIQQLPTDNIRNIQFDEKVFEILADNLNTPKLLAEIHEALNNNENIYANLVSLEASLLKLGLFEKEQIAQIPQSIEDLAQQRIQAKTDKNYALADELRTNILNAGYIIKDVKNDK